MFKQIILKINLLILAIHFQKYRMKNKIIESKIKFSEKKYMKCQFVSAAHF